MIERPTDRFWRVAGQLLLAVGVLPLCAVEPIQAQPAQAQPAQAKPAQAGAKSSVVRDGDRVLFLGDSITHAGHYVARIQAHYWRAHPGWQVEWINLGLPSETASGLSEPDHPFPRPCVHERLARALERVKPTVVFIAYGMNDGIYHPASPDRLRAYQEGIDGVIEAAKRAGARVVLMTPTLFDPAPLAGKTRAAGAETYAWFAPYVDYDEVLGEYARWILEQRERVELVVDLRTPLVAETRRRRETRSDFTFAKDGIHLDVDGHRIMAETILKALGERPGDVPADALELAERRTALLHDAWLSHVGHQRPGMKPGLPLADAEREAARLVPR